MFVESYDRFNDVGDYDPKSGHLAELSRAERADALTGPEGHYARLDDTLVVFYRVGDQLWLRIGEEARALDVEGSSARWDTRGDRSVLRLLDGDETVAHVEYRPGPKRGPILSDDPTPFVSAEDWDFGLFIRNVVMDDARRSRIYSTDPAR